MNVRSRKNKTNNNYNNNLLLIVKYNNIIQVVWHTPIIGFMNIVFDYMRK